MLYKVADSTYRPSGDLYKVLAPAAAGNYDASLNSGITSAVRSSKAMLYPSLYDLLYTKGYGLAGAMAGEQFGHPIIGSALAAMAARYLTHNKVYDMAKANRLGIDESLRTKLPDTVFDKIYKWLNKQKLDTFEKSFQTVGGLNG